MNPKNFNRFNNNKLYFFQVFSNRLTIMFKFKKDITLNRKERINQFIMNNIES